MLWFELLITFIPILMTWQKGGKIISVAYICYAFCDVFGNNIVDCKPWDSFELLMTNFRILMTCQNKFYSLHRL